MKTIELKYLLPYVPYNLRVWNIEMEVDFLLTLTEDGEANTIDVEYFMSTKVYKLLLKPLSEINNKHAIWSLLSEKLRMTIEVLGFPHFHDLKVVDYDLLVSNHFDIFKLIDKNLAFDINKIIR